MRISSILITGWMPFEGTQLLELPAGPVAVVGMHSGDPRRSNRSGKTSLLEAITWCLYGVHRKRLDDEIINRASSLCEVVVVLDDVKVKRSRVRGSSTKLVVSFGDMSKGGSFTELSGDAAQNALDGAIGLGLDDYLATSCFRQGDVESIISRTAGERLALVSEWLQQSRWIDAKKIQARRSANSDTQLAEKRAALANAADYLLSPEAFGAAEQELGGLRDECLRLEVEMTGLSERMMESVEAKSQLSKHAELKLLRSQTTEIRARLEGRAAIDKEKDAAQESESAAAIIASETRSAVAELVQVRTRGFDGQCPVTCEACPVADKVEETVVAASQLFKRRESENTAAAQELQRARSVLNEARSKSNGMERLAAQYQQVVQQGKLLSSSLTLSEKEASAAPSAQPLQLELEDKRRRYSEASRKAGEIERSLSDTATAAERHARLATEVTAAEETSKVSSLALRAIGSVPARIAAQQLGELEREANFLLQGSGVSLRFSWARELADKTPVCDECGFVYPSKRGDQCPTCKAARGKKRSMELELLCDDGSGVEEDVRFNSGGTRAVVGSSIRLAASAMLRRLRSSRAAWAIVDEPFGSLDAENKEQLARTFAGMLGSVGLEQALVVSHDPSLLAALPHRIVVDKDGDRSTVRVE